MTRRGTRNSDGEFRLQSGGTPSVPSTKKGGSPGRAEPFLGNVVCVWSICVASIARRLISCVGKRGFAKSCSDFSLNSPAYDLCVLPASSVNRCSRA